VINVEGEKEDEEIYSKGQTIASERAVNGWRSFAKKDREEGAK